LKKRRRAGPACCCWRRRCVHARRCAWGRGPPVVAAFGGVFMWGAACRGMPRRRRLRDELRDGVCSCSRSSVQTFERLWGMANDEAGAIVRALSGRRLVYNTCACGFSTGAAGARRSAGGRARAARAARHLRRVCRAARRARGGRRGRRARRAAHGRRAACGWRCARHARTLAGALHTFEERCRQHCAGPLWCEVGVARIAQQAVKLVCKQAVHLAV